MLMGEGETPRLYSRNKRHPPNCSITMYFTERRQKRGKGVISAMKCEAHMALLHLYKKSHGL
jgi:hypothetical protein